MAGYSNNTSPGSPEKGDSETDSQNSVKPDDSLQNFWGRMDESQISEEVREGFEDIRADGEVGMREQLGPPFEEIESGDVERIKKEIKQWWNNLNQQTRSYIKNHPKSPIFPDDSSPLAGLKFSGHIKVSDEMSGEEYLQKYKQKIKQEVERLFNQLRQLEAEAIAKTMQSPNNSLANDSAIINTRTNNLDKSMSSAENSPEKSTDIDLEPESVSEKGVKSRKSVFETPVEFVNELEEEIKSGASFIVENAEANEDHRKIWCKNLQVETGEDGQRVVSFRPIYHKRAFKQGKDRFEKEAGDRQSMNLVRLAALLYKGTNTRRLPGTLNIPGKFVHSNLRLLEKNEDPFSENHSLQRDREPASGQVSIEQFRKDTEGEVEKKNVTEALTQQRMKGIIEKNVYSGKSKEQIYDKIWSYAQQVGEIQASNGARYFKKSNEEAAKDPTSADKWVYKDKEGVRKAAFPNKKNTFVEFLDNQFGDYLDNLKEAVKTIPIKDPLDQDYVNALSSEVKKELRSGKNLYRAYVYNYQKLRAQHQATNIDVSDELERAFSLGEQDSLASKTMGLSRKIIQKAQNQADIQAFLHIAPKRGLRTLKENARRALKDDKFRKAFLKAEKQKAKLQEIKQKIRKEGDKLKQIDDLIYNLKTNPMDHVKKAESKISDLEEDKTDPTNSDKGKQLSKSTEDQEKTEKRNISVGDKVKLYDRGSPRWNRAYLVDDTLEKNGKTYIKTTKGDAYRPAENFELEKLKTKEDIDNYIDLDNIKDIISSAESIDEAVNTILSQDAFFFRSNPEPTNYVRQSDSRWSKVVDTDDKKIEAKNVAENKLRSQLRDWVESSEIFRQTAYLRSAQGLITTIIESYPDQEGISDGSEALDYLSALKDVNSHIMSIFQELEEDGQINKENLNKVSHWMRGVVDDIEVILKYTEDESSNVDKLIQELENNYQKLQQAQ